tara:strand:- start:16107 stop:16931 length:825 start_codon:yes stop_codon:yes gene_type:complete
MRFIAAMDHSGGSTGSVLERYGQEYTEENKMDLVHDMRLRMINSPEFNSNNIWAAILYKDSVDRGAVEILKNKGIESYLKIDSGCNEDGMLKEFNLFEMTEYALWHGCTGTKMRSIVKNEDIIDSILDQQFKHALKIANQNLIPIIEPEIPIDIEHKHHFEMILNESIKPYLDSFAKNVNKRFDNTLPQVILKLTIPDEANLYHDLSQHNSVKKLVGLSGGYETTLACKKLSENLDMSASFSRGLSEGLYSYQDESEFNKRITENITNIEAASS